MERAVAKSVRSRAASEQSFDTDEAAARLKRHLRKQVKKLLRTDQGFCEKADPDAVHDLRVSTRRLGTVLRIAGARAPKKSTEKARKQLKRLRHALSAPRDLDVLLSGLRRFRTATPNPRRRKLYNLTIRHVRNERRAADKQAKRYLKRFDVERLAASVSKAARRRLIGRFSLAAFEKATLDAERSWQAAVKNAQRNDNPARLHRVRIKTKTLRYLLELLSRLFEDHRCEALIGSLRKLQDDLGRWRERAELYRRLIVILAATPALEADQTVTDLIGAARGMARLNDHRARRIITGLHQIELSKPVIDRTGAAPVPRNGGLYLPATSPTKTRAGAGAISSGQLPHELSV